jgi:hypothetical protein
MAQQNSSTPGVDPDLTHVDNVAVPLTSYEHLRPRAGKDDTEGYARPGNKSQVLARTSVSTDRAGAALRIQTVAAGDRARTLREYQDGTPVPEAQPDRTSMIVAENRAGANGQSPLWSKRRQQRQAQ